MEIPDVLRDLVIAVIAVLLLFALGCALYNATFGGGSEEHAARQNFALLTTQIDYLLANPELFAYEGVTYYFVPGYTLAGFDSYWERNQNWFDANGKFTKRHKPSECFDKRAQEKACLCLYEGTAIQTHTDDADPEKGLVQCKIFEQAIVFAGEWNVFLGHTTQTIYGEERDDITYDFIENDDTNYHFLFMRSTFSKGKSVLVDLYLEKYQKSGGATYVFLTQSSKKALSRYKLYSKQCPQGSVAACVNQNTGAEYGAEPLVADAACDINPPVQLLPSVAKVCDDVDDNKLCEVICVPNCIEGSIDYPCLCAGTYKTYGFCKKNAATGELEWVEWEVDCSKFADDECWAYCQNAQGDPSVETPFCGEQGAQICNADICHFGGDKGCGAVAAVPLQDVWTCQAKT